MTKDRSDTARRLLSETPYAALAGQVETEVGEIGVGADTMVGKTAQQRPVQGLVQVTKAVNDYAGHFDPPSLKPIRNDL